MATSYNNWPAHPDKNQIGVVQHPIYSGGIKAGDVTTMLTYVSNQLHARVEKVNPPWCWGYAYKQNVNNPSKLSCHASGTAIDFNAPAHPNGKGGTFNAAQVRTIEAILRECGGAVRWLKGYDEMHFEIAVSAAALKAAVAKLPGSKPPAAVAPPKPPTATPPKPPVVSGTAFPLPAGYYFGPLSGPKQSISGMARDGSDTKYRPHIKRIQKVTGAGQDGLYGPGSIAATKKWQTANKVKADGLVGPVTWKAMKL